LRFSEAEKGFNNAIRLKDSAERENRLFHLFYDDVAVLREQQKDNAGASKAYQAALDAARKAAALAPKAFNYRSNASQALWKIGQLQRDDAEALETFRSAFD